MSSTSINKNNQSMSQNLLLQQSYKLKEKIVSSLNDLINSFDFQRDFKEEKNNLILNIQKEINFDNFSDYITQICHLITTSQKKYNEQNRLFFKNIEEQLVFFNNFLIKETENILTSHSEDIHFTESFSLNLNEMKCVIEDVDTIENIKYKLMKSISDINIKLSQHKDLKEEQIKSFNVKLSEFEQKISTLKLDYRDMASHFNSKIEELNEEKETDALTGIKNRNGYQRLINKVYHDYLQKDETKRNHLNIVMCDIDLFKSINDEYGHHAGDNMLCAVANIINDGLRKTDYVCRLGGEEFIIIMTDSYYSDCLKIIERIRAKIADTIFKYDKYNINITCSFGLAYFGNEDDVPTDVFKRADDALYESKRTGRNKIHLNDPLEHNGIISYNSLVG